MIIPTDYPETGPLLMDGAMGTLLQQRGYDLPPPEWSAAVVEHDPEAVTRVHREYLDAGADIITTATFRTTRAVYHARPEPGLAKKLTLKAARCAKEATEGQKTLIAGSVAPVEDCYSPELVPEAVTLYNQHREQVFWLLEGGVDFLLFETMNTIREAEVCCDIARDLQAPFMVSFICQDSEQLLSGERITDALDRVVRFDPEAVLFNCTHTHLITDILTQISATWDIPLGGYANVGDAEPAQGGEITSVMSPEEYASHVARWLALSPAVVGGCCGTTPGHIRRLREVIEIRRSQAGFPKKSGVGEQKEEAPGRPETGKR